MRDKAMRDKAMQSNAEQQDTDREQQDTERERETDRDRETEREKERDRDRETGGSAAMPRNSQPSFSPIQQLEKTISRLRDFTRVFGGGFRGDCLIFHFVDPSFQIWLDPCLECGRYALLTPKSL